MHKYVCEIERKVQQNKKSFPLLYVILLYFILL